MKPVLKGPRPYIFNSADTGSPNRYTRLKTSKREHIFFPIIIKASNRYSVDPALVQAIIMAESGYNPMAVSKKGAMGLMQLMPATAVYLGVEDSFNPEHNVNAGVRYLKKLLNQFEGDLLLAVAAYNAGSANVRKYQGIPPYKATRYYVKKVLEYYQYYQKEIEQKGSKI
ncbi:MAG: lytic transglycosylase domain-containing protein [Deltaproteobacteria bacterium]|nr:lytic transglycosylase domain-containing protein [Deltaproteobacteria bacterium]